MAETQLQDVQDLQSHNKGHDVIDLSVLPRELDAAVAFDQGGSTTEADAPGTSRTVDSFRGLRLKDFDVGERLGAKRDGGGGYQGCNSRVFRVKLRRPRQQKEMDSSGAACGVTPKAEEERKEIRFSRGISASSSPVDIRHSDTMDYNSRVCSSRGFGRVKRRRSIFCASGCDDGGSDDGGASRLSDAAGRYGGNDPAAQAAYHTPYRPTGNAGVAGAASELVSLRERLFRGSFGVCFSGHDQTSDDESTPVSRGCDRSRGMSGLRLDQPGETAPKEKEFALKMALTLRGQDPVQVQREMATEMAVLVGGRIPPHSNIMRGIHSFQDEIGDDLRPLLWSGLGPRAGEDLSLRTSFLVMPLFTVGSLQALLNKRIGRCAGPPFLRLLDAMRYLEQMLSAVGHLLEHGLAHNDIKPDNWLLTNDQRSLVLTDFGSCVDSLQSLPLPTTSAVALNPPGQPLIPQADGAIVAPVVDGASSSAEGSEYDQGSARAVYEACALLGACAPALGSNSTSSTSMSTPQACSAPVDRGEAIAAHADVAAFAGRSPTTDARKVDMVGGRVPATPRTESEDSHALGAVVSPAVTCREDEKRRRGCHVNGNQGARSSSTKRRDLSESLVFPFSDYFSAGAPCFLAPELERAWRERGVLDFRRSDVYSVGVCMYHMLRPGGPGTDTRWELMREDTLLHPRESSVEREWPLPIFPDHKGGCPFEVAQLCHGLLQRDPTCRVSASEGHSLAKWLVSRLKAAEPRDDVRSVGSTLAVPVAARGGDKGRDYQHPTGDLRFHSYHLIEARRGDSCPGPLEAPGSDGLRLLGKRSRDEDEATVFGESLCDGFGKGLPAAVSKEGVGDEERGAAGSSKAAVEARKSQIVEDRHRSRKREGAGDPDDLVRTDRVSQMRFCFARAAPEELFEALQALGWDVQVACDAFGHGGEGQKSNSTRFHMEIDDGDAPASPRRASTLEMPSMVVPNRLQGAVSVDRKPRLPEFLWFTGVAKELRGRIRTATVSPFRHREFSLLDRRQLPPYSDRSLGI